MSNPEPDPVKAAEERIAQIKQANQTALQQAEQELQAAREVAAEQARQQAENDRQAILAYKTKIDNLKLALTDLLGDGNDPQIQTTLDTLNGARADLKKQAEAYNAGQPVQLDTIKQLLAPMETRVADLEKFREEVKAELKQAKTWSAGAQTQMNDLSKRVQKLENGVQSAQSDASKAREDAAAARETANKVNQKSAGTNVQQQTKLAKASPAAWTFATLSALVVLTVGAIAINAWIVAATPAGHVAPLSGLSAFLIGLVLAGGTFIGVLTLVRYSDNKTTKDSNNNPPTKELQATALDNRHGACRGATSFTKGTAS